MINIGKKKTTASIFAQFTKDLEEVANREQLEAEKQEKLEQEAKTKKLEAIAESAKAKGAIDNIMSMLTGGPSVDV